MYGSKDLNLPFPADSFTLGGKDDDSEQQQQHQQMSSGLLRYRSAPSTLLGDVCEEFLPHRSTSPEAASMFARFMGPPPHPRDQQHHHHPGGKQESDAPQRGSFASPTFQMLFHSPPQDHHHRQIQSSVSASPALTIESHGGVVGDSGGLLLRQSSSPAGLFSNLQAENGGYAGMSGGMGGFRLGEPGPGRLKGQQQISFSSRQGSSSAGLMSQISEMGSDGMGGGSSPEESGIRNGNRGGGYLPGYPVASWEDSVLLSDSFAGSKRSRDPSSDAQQNGDARNHHVSNLTHHFSLPKSSSELNAMEKFLHFQDAVPCKIRAKRGCATHPRSIAERVRRTRISERMRKLQELVPNMDKQTNTADMLDLAVEYIKELQKSVNTLTDSRANCTCYSKHK